ncbi:MAG: ATPase, T2SS/T4P/T4SS family [Gemmataceae bacterium]
MSDSPAKVITPPSNLPIFDAAPVCSIRDATVFLHRNPILEGGDGEAELCRQYQSVADYLLWPETYPRPEAFKAWPAFPGHLKPRLSTAADVKFIWRRRLRTARALICFADRQHAVSVTLRSVTPTETNEREQADVRRRPTLEGNNYIDLIHNKYKPSNLREDGKHRFWFSVEDQAAAIWTHIRDASQGSHLHGLVVLTGATDSSKSLIARGLIDLVLQDAKYAARRTPHLVTFEDPIEEYYAGLVDEKSLKCWRERVMYKVVKAASIPPVLMAHYLGVDYTPREKGVDVHDLRQGFADALRQTPTVFYVGEIRDAADWPQVLEFAGTGHLVVTTAHAGSLLEALTKLLTATKATTPAARRQCASKLLAVVHLKPLGQPKDAGQDDRRLLLPAVWRRTPAGLAGLTGGLGAVVQTFPDPSRAASGESCLGRRHFLEWMLRFRYQPLPKHANDQAIGELRTLATADDLLG